MTYLYHQFGQDVFFTKWSLSPFAGNPTVDWRHLITRFSCTPISWLYILDRLSIRSIPFFIRLVNPCWHQLHASVTLPLLLISLSIPIVFSISWLLVSCYRYIIIYCYIDTVPFCWLLKEPKLSTYLLVTRSESPTFLVLSTYFCLVGEAFLVLTSDFH